MSTTVAVVMILFLATLIRSAFGFGQALIAVPLLALFMPAAVAAPIAALSSITAAAVILAQDRADVDVRSAVRLVLPTLVGIPLGLLLLTRLPEPVVKGGLGSLIALFALSQLLGRPRIVLATERSSWLFGFVAGVLGGAYGMNGPPLVIYGGLRGWSPARFRATLQGYFFPASVVGMAGYWIAGLWTAEVTRAYLIALPGSLLAIYVGRGLNRRIPAEGFLTWIHGSLFVVGAVLVVQALRG
jgi:uncharacterized membrane protein YfcA